MTLCAMLFGETMPIAITDSLISTKSSATKPMITPIKKMPGNPTSLGYIPLGMAVKIKHIGTNLAMLYAGTVKHINKISKIIEKELESGEYSTPIHTKVKKYIEENNLSAEFLIIFRNKNDRLCWYGYKFTKFQHDNYGPIRLIGSGSEPFKSILKNNRGCDIPKNHNTTEYIDSIFLAALHTVGALTSDFMATKSDVEDSSSGALFYASPLPELYGWGNTHPEPDQFKHGIFQIFSEVRQDELFVYRIAYSRKINGRPKIEVFVFSGEIKLAPNSRSLSIPGQNFEIYEIDASWETTKNRQKYHPIGDISIHQLIVYTKQRTHCNHKGDSVNFKVASSRNTPCLTIQSNNLGFEISLTDSYFESLYEQQTKSECLICKLDRDTRTLLKKYFSDPDFVIEQISDYDESIIKFSINEQSRKIFLGALEETIKREITNFMTQESNSSED